MSVVGVVLFECDQCTYRERRRADQEPWPCPVCGYMRWSVVAEAGVDSGPGAADEEGTG